MHLKKNNNNNNDIEYNPPPTRDAYADMCSIARHDTISEDEENERYKHRTIHAFTRFFSSGCVCVCFLCVLCGLMS